ncbi:hypothetical protein Aduo_012339 [Ancylostoma duodenale]
MESQNEGEYPSKRPRLAGTEEDRRGEKAIGCCIAIFAAGVSAALLVVTLSYVVLDRSHHQFPVAHLNKVIKEPLALKRFSQARQITCFSSTAEGKVNVKVTDPLTTTSKKVFRKQTRPPKTTRVRTAREVSAEKFVPPPPLSKRSVGVSRLTTADEQLTKTAVTAGESTAVNQKLTGGTEATKGLTSLEKQPTKIAVDTEANDTLSTANESEKPVVGQEVSTQEIAGSAKLETQKPVVRQKVSTQKNAGRAKHKANTRKAPWLEYPELATQAVARQRSFGPKYKKLANPGAAAGDSDEGEPAMQDSASADKSSPPASSAEQGGSSGTRWNRTFIPLLILIIILALILIFILICCLFLIEADKTPAGAKLQSPLLERQPSGKVKSAPRKKDSAKAPPPAPPEAESTARGPDGANFQPIHVSGRPPNRKDGESGENVVPLLTDQEIRVSKEGGADAMPHERPDPDSPPKDNMPKITTDHMF